MLEQQEKLDPIDKEISDLSNGLRMLESEQNFLLERAETHQKSKSWRIATISLFTLFFSVAQKTNSRVRYWFLYQILLVSAAVVFEIMFLKSFFEKRRVV